MTDKVINKNNIEILCLSVDEDFIPQIALNLQGNVSYTIVRSSTSCLKLLEKQNFPMLIIDDDIFGVEAYENRSKVEFEEIYNYVMDKNPSTCVLILIEKRQNRFKNFDLRNQRSFFMLKSLINTKNLFSFYLLSRKAPYRIVNMRDVKESLNCPVPFYHFKPEVDDHVRCLQAGQVIDQKYLDILKKKNIHTLYIKTSEYEALDADTKRKITELLPISEELNYLDTKLRDIYIQLLDIMHVGPAIGQEITRDLQLIVGRLNILLETARDQYVHLNQLFFPCWDFIGHMINTSVISIILGKLLCLDRTEDVAVVALVHDIGEFFVESDSLLYKRKKWNDLELIKHLKHPIESLRILERKNLVLDKDQKEIVLSHHEMVDGSGAPKGLNASSIGLLSQFFTLVDRFERIYSIKSGEPLLSFWEAWKILRKFSTEGVIGTRLNEQMLEELEHIFQQKIEDNKKEAA